MKNIFYTLIILVAVGLSSCKKNADNQTIQQFDDSQIQGYIQQNNLTGMKRDLSGGDTTGIYYQILDVGTGPLVDYPDKVSYVYSYHTFDNEYSSTDTILNHTNVFLGHVVPNAIQLSIKNIAMRKGTKMRLLIPSRLAFGRNGFFSGGTHINGNECLDYTVNLVYDDYDAVAKINHQGVYDALSIQKYIAANSLTGYVPLKDSFNNTLLFYKITQPGTGTAPISINSVVGLQYTGYLFDGTVVESFTDPDPTVTSTSFSMYDAPNVGFQNALPLIKGGGQISFILPSGQAFGQTGSVNTVTGTTIPPFNCLRYDVSVLTVTN